MEFQNEYTTSSFSSEILNEFGPSHYNTEENSFSQGFGHSSKNTRKKRYYLVRNYRAIEILKLS